MKKIFLCVATVMLFICCFSIVSFAAVFLSGDINSDGQVTADDARTALRASVGLENLSAMQKKYADADNDGKITAADARLILRTSVGLETPTYRTVATDEEPVEEKNTDSAREASFKSLLYDYAHNFYDDEGGYGCEFSNAKFNRTGSITEKIYGTVGKWCCFYTVHDVLRPVLQQAGYSESRINELAPIYFSKKTISTALTNIAKSETNSFSGLSIPSWLISDIYPFFIPSVLANYYQEADDDICTMYTFYKYYDDVVTSSVVKRSKNASDYEPEVGDVVFMSNKTRTYVNGYPTVDHTAQIIKVYENGSFLCTEGSIIVTDKPDELPRVRERKYVYDESKRTYVYKNNDVVIVLACAKLNLE